MRSFRTPIRRVTTGNMRAQDARESPTWIIELGASVHEQVQDVGEGIKVGTVKDPFGNVFGIIENPHFNIQ